MSDYQAPGEPQVSGWAIGGITFAACVLTLVGAFQIIGGLAAILNDDFFVNVRNYSFEVDTSAWAGSIPCSGYCWSSPASASSAARPGPGSPQSFSRA
jgi:hypothetical protein